MSARVLCVDDEPRVLNGLESHLGLEHDVVTATSGAEGLDCLGAGGPFDVVVSDMRMPGMDGAEFLAEVRRRAPSTMRVLLTGQTDLEPALRAVNEGQLFRFLTKPCPPEMLLRCIEEASEVRRLRQVEKDLLELTLKGAVSVLADVLGAAVPAMSQRARHVRAIAQTLGEGLGLPDEARWELDVAALLTGLGSISVPADVLERVAAGLPISKNEQALLDAVPEVGGRLLRQVPRLEGAAHLLASARPQMRSVDSNAEQCSLAVLELALLCADEHAAGTSWRRVKKKVATQLGESIAQALGEEPHRELGLVTSVRAQDLCAGMVLQQDVHTQTGQLVVRSGSELTSALVERLRGFAKNVGLVDPIRVRA